MKSLNWLVKLLPFAVIVGIVLLFFHPVWREGKVPLPADLVVGSYFPWLDYDWGYPTGVPVKNPITSDAISFSFPMKMLAIDLMAKGQWPLWNPYIFAGTPLLANFQSSPFSPTNIIYLFTDKLTGWSVQIILQHVIAALGIYFLLRYFRVSKTGSTFSGILFAFSGFNLIWSEWNSHTLAASFIPFLILFVYKFLKYGKWWGPLISVALALQIFSGYPQIVLYSLIVLSVLVLVNHKLNKKFLIKIFFLTVYILIGFGLSAVQLLPGYELLSLSQRWGEAIPYEWAFLDWKQIITFIAPDYFGNHATGNFWGPKNYTSTVGFVSVVGLIFALFAIRLFRVKREIKFLVSITFISLVLSLPNPISNFIWSSGFLGLEAGVSLRALVLFTFSISALAGFGLDHVLISKSKIGVKLPFLLIGTLIAVFIAYSFSFVEDEAWKGVVARRNLFIPLFSYLVTFFVIVFIVHIKPLKFFGIFCLFFVLIFELFYFGWKFTPFSSRHIVYPETPVIKFLTSQEKPLRFDGGDVVPANLFIPYKIESISGYDAVYPLEIAKFIAVVNSGDPESKPQDRYGIITKRDSPMYKLTNTKYVLVKNDKLGAFDEERFQEVFRDKSVVVLEDKNALARTFSVDQWEVIGDDKEILDLLSDKAFPVKEKILLKEEPENIYGNNFIFASETWYPGWKAFVDGVETKIYKANYAFRAVLIPGSESKVEFVYKPDSFYNGIIVSALSLLALLFFALISKKEYR